MTIFPAGISRAARVRRLPALFLLLASLGGLWSARARAEGELNPLAAIRAERWAEADGIAARLADPVAAKLVRYYRLLSGVAGSAEIARFMQDSPDWPNQAQLERRRQEALAREPAETAALAQCDSPPPTQAAAMLRCAEALSGAGRRADAAGLAKRAWITAITDPAMEAAFGQRWDSALTAEDQWARFQNLAWSDPVAAARQIPRLDPARRAAAEARLALKRDDPEAETLFTSLPEARRRDVSLFIDRVRFLRRSDRVAEALAAWQHAGEPARAAIPDRAPEFWAERHLLIRRLLKDGDARGAYALASSHGMTGSEAAMDAEFLAGFIALRRLNDPAPAVRHFQALAGMSKAAITQGRAWYWSGRAEEMSGRDPGESYRRAAAWATTFYGQRAALALGEDGAALASRIKALSDPVWTHETVLAFAGHEVVRAASLLVAWGDSRRARAFLLRMDEIAPVPAERALVAEFALRLGLPETAVFAARRAGRDGLMLPRAGWPVPYEPPSLVEPPLSLGVMRQESSFDVGAISVAGARGLMQLMPGTAQGVAKQLGVPTSAVALTSDPEHNMRLGTAYLREVLDRFGGAAPLAVAAYNAGPGRVNQWLAENGDPRGSSRDSAASMLDWIELIPFNETRNYVQRVLENTAIYQARRGELVRDQLAQ